MLKEHWNLGQTGNAWLDDAWFTIVPAGQEIESCAVDVAYTYRAKDALVNLRTANRRIYSDVTELIDQLRCVRAEIESGAGRFVLAFDRSAGAIDLVRHREWYADLNRRPIGNNIYREVLGFTLYERDLRAELAHTLSIFQMESGGPVDIRVMAGTIIGPEPEFGGGTYKVGEVDGTVYLIRVAESEPVYRLTEEDIRQLWHEAYSNSTPFHDFRLDPRSISPRIEAVMAKFFTRCFGAIPQKKSGGEPE